MDKAGDQALRAGQIIRRLRDFVARGESERRVENVRKLVEEASALALVGAKDTGVRVRLISPHGADFLLADKVQIQQVVLNLMRNAIEAMETTESRDLLVTAAPAKDNMVEISVADTGSGIAPEICDAVISTVHHHQTGRHGRRTFDLTNDRRGPWRLHHGTPQFRQGRGYFLSPCRLSRVRKMAIPSNMGLVHVIDDDDALRDSLAFLLRTAHIEVRDYSSASAFLEALPDLNLSCIITDVRMPGLSGIDLLKRLKDLKINVPVIVITGHADVPLAVEAMKFGATDFLEKPFDDEVLIASVQSALRNRQGESKRQTERAAIESRLADLSNRERDVLIGLVAGRANKQIAFDLGISPRTVEIYRANLMDKMKAASLSDLVRMALIAEIVGRD